MQLCCPCYRQNSLIDIVGLCLHDRRRRQIGEIRPSVRLCFDLSSKRNILYDFTIPLNETMTHPHVTINHQRICRKCFFVQCDEMSDTSIPQCYTLLWASPPGSLLQSVARWREGETIDSFDVNKICFWMNQLTQLHWCILGGNFSLKLTLEERNICRRHNLLANRCSPSKKNEWKV